jgi:S-adenosylmethionine hydrolase
VSRLPGAGRVITLLSDFGLRDGYVGAMKGAALGVSPGALVLDLAHEVPPGDVIAGAVAWADATVAFPPGAIHVGVVDPGVGSGRRAVAVQGSRAIFVAPDNGLLSFALPPGEATKAVSLDDPAFHRVPVSATFHGRDVFAPVAGHLAAGVPLEALGRPVGVDSLERLPASRGARRVGSDLVGRVIAVDRYGNLRTDLRLDEVPEPSVVTLTLDGGDTLTVPRISRTFADVAPGALLAYEGSAGTLEIALRDGSAAEASGAAVGSRVTLSPAPRP